MRDDTKYGAKCCCVWAGWGAATVILALIGHIGRNGWWIAALITGTVATIYGIAAFNEWRDRRALAQRDRRGESGAHTE